MTLFEVTFFTLRYIEDIFYCFSDVLQLLSFEKKLYLKLQKYDEPESNCFSILDSLNGNFR